MEILAEYLLQQRHVIDEHHWWVNTVDEADIAFIRGLCERHSDFFKFVPFPAESSRLEVPVQEVHDSADSAANPDGPKGWKTVHRFFGPAYRVPGVLYLRFDDDICFIADDAVERLLAFRLQHRQYLLVFAQIVNNGAMDHIRQRCGAIEYAPFLASPACNTVGSPSWAEANHWSFLRQYSAGKLEEMKTIFRQYIAVWRERISINCFAWWGEDMGLLQVPEEDEHYLTKVATKQTGRLNAVCGGALVCHYAFGPQREWIDRTPLLDYYRNILEGKPLVWPQAQTHTYPVEKMTVAFFTCDRSARGGKNYIQESLRNWSRATAGKSGVVQVVVDGTDAAFLGSEQSLELGSGMQLAVEVYPEDEWNEKKSWDTNRRISYSYKRALELAWADPESCGVLICEDDVDFRPGFLPKLQEVLDNLAADGKRFFTLSLYTVGDLDPRFEFDMGDLYGIYPEWLFWGGQGVFFSRDAIPLALDFFARHGWRDVKWNHNCNDRLVGRFGQSMFCMCGLEGGHYRAYRDLVQHTGEVVSMSKFYHFSDTFARPWPGEETDSWTQGPPEFGADTPQRKNAPHIAMPEQKWVWLSVPLTGGEHWLRSLAHSQGLPVGGTEFIKDAELPCFADNGSIPELWQTGIMLRDPMSRLAACWHHLRTTKNGTLSAEVKDFKRFKVDMSLVDFAQLLAETSEAERPEVFRSQSWFLQGKQPVFVGCLEHSEADFPRACAAMDLGVIRQFLGRPFPSTASINLDEKTRNLALQAFAEDFVLWDKANALRSCKSSPA